jgi:hypothetical protein
MAGGTGTVVAGDLVREMFNVPARQRLPGS